MRKRLYLLLVILISGFAFYLAGCNSASDEKKEQDSTASETKTMSKEDMIKRGDYIVTTGSCNDCHSPKVMTQMGPLPDSSKLLSGHPANEPLPPIYANSLKPGNWISMAPDITAFVGPWGISYAANLTPDSATGIGAWSEATFMNTVRSGKHLGNGRDILPPMPWPFIGKLTDDDLKAVYAYLRSLPPISNKVPAPVSPPDVMKMAAAK
jgi:mono/diheme cytochrome c family protein